MSVTALIVAAGRGVRAAGPKSLIPKQYLPVGGVPMLTRAIAAFAGHPGVDDVIVAIHPDDVGLYEAASQSFSSRLRPPVAGGAERQDSVRSGLEALAANPPDRVLIHDAARPFVEPALITRVIASLDEHDAALPCVPVTDTLTTAKDGRVTGTLPRDRALARADAARLPLRCDPCSPSRRGEGGKRDLHRRRRHRAMVRSRRRSGRRLGSKPQAHLGGGHRERR